MLRSSTGLLTRLAVNGVDTKCGNTAFALEFVRWRRKPRWVPVAKSKMFRVPERKRQTPEEKAELLRLHNNYKTQLRSVRSYLQEEVIRNERISTADHVVLTVAQEADDLQRCFDENEAWNKKIAESRNTRLEKERQDRAVYIKERLELAREREEEEMERIEEIVRQEKERAKHFVTADKLQEAIEVALANPVDYNFSVDMKGNIYRGRSTVPDGTGGGSSSKATTASQPEPEQITASN